jgi:TrmH family RNA methyltransferase
MMKTISSSQNPIIKEIRSLKNSKDRNKKGLFFVEGVRIIEEAFLSQAQIKYLVFSEEFISSPGFERIEDLFNNDTNNDINEEKSGAIKKYIIPAKLFKEISDTETPQGVLAVIEIKKKTLADLASPKGLYIFLDEIRDPGNMGTIIRTADAAGFSGVIISRNSADIYNPKVLRSTMGSIFHIDIYHCNSTDTLTALRELKTRGLRILSSHLEGSTSIYEANIGERTALVVGNEATGISQAAIDEADLLISIPMPGRAESLNASVAAGVMMFEAVRQKGR